MASTILEQILENLHRGSSLRQVDVRDPDDEPRDAIEEEFLQLLSVGLETIETELLAHPGVRRARLDSPAVRANLVAALTQILGEELGPTRRLTGEIGRVSAESEWALAAAPG
ncbi:MAG: hypothetical protein AB7O52_02225 [Planctomycetota bacterium]